MDELAPHIRPAHCSPSRRAGGGGHAAEAEAGSDDVRPSPFQKAAAGIRAALFSGRLGHGHQGQHGRAGESASSESSACTATDAAQCKDPPACPRHGVLAGEELQTYLGDPDRRQLKVAELLVDKAKQIQLSNPLSLRRAHVINCNLKVLLHITAEEEKPLIKSIAPAFVARLDQFAAKVLPDEPGEIILQAATNAALAAADAALAAARAQATAVCSRELLLLELYARHMPQRQQIRLATANDACRSTTSAGAEEEEEAVSSHASGVLVRRCAKITAAHISALPVTFIDVPVRPPPLAHGDLDGVGGASAAGGSVRAAEPSSLQKRAVDATETMPPEARRPASGVGVLSRGALRSVGEAAEAGRVHVFVCNGTRACTFAPDSGAMHTTEQQAAKAAPEGVGMGVGGAPSEEAMPNVLNAEDREGFEYLGAVQELVMSTAPALEQRLNHHSPATGSSCTTECAAPVLAVCGAFGEDGWLGTDAQSSPDGAVAQPMLLHGAAMLLPAMADIVLCTPSCEFSLHPSLSAGVAADGGGAEDGGAESAVVSAAIAARGRLTSPQMRALRDDTHGRFNAQTGLRTGWADFIGTPDEIRAEVQRLLSRLASMRAWDAAAAAPASAAAADATVPLPPHPPLQPTAAPLLLVGALRAPTPWAWEWTPQPDHREPHACTERRQPAAPSQGAPATATSPRLSLVQKSADNVTRDGGAASLLQTIAAHGKAASPASSTATIAWAATARDRQAQAPKALTTLIRLRVGTSTGVDGRPTLSAVHKLVLACAAVPIDAPHVLVITIGDCDASLHNEGAGAFAEDTTPSDADNTTPSDAEGTDRDMGRVVQALRRLRRQHAQRGLGFAVLVASTAGAAVHGTGAAPPRANLGAVAILLHMLADVSIAHAHTQWVCAAAPPLYMCGESERCADTLSEAEAVPQQTLALMALLLRHFGGNASAVGSDERLRRSRLALLFRKIWSAPSSAVVCTDGAKATAVVFDSKAAMAAGLVDFNCASAHEVTSGARGHCARHPVTQ